MDVNTLRTVLTVVFFAVFIGIVLWAWSDRSRKGFDEAARLPFDDDEGAGAGRAPLRR